ncbi:SRPBCC family protein [Sneathiella aquimaris]|uniref:SRPBCC family protein n=1 Tax=Sneathiella aquimaris TaxID=2599305 RepID=UPI00146C3B43|nr:SRPBCC family protein [Sneathiella aquimaris]
MAEKITSHFSHEIIIDAPAGAVLDYVSNPNSWPEWIAASHEMDSPDRPLEEGDTFIEQWQTRTGPAQLRWKVTKREHPYVWKCETSTPFTGPILITYKVVSLDDGRSLYTRIVSNPDRPKPITEAANKAMNEEAALSLANIKANVEARQAQK